MKTAAMFLVVMGFCVPAMANNGMQTIEYDLNIPAPDTVFVDCLNEYITGVTSITARVHEFETPSGIVHILDNWSFTTVFAGQSTGRAWTNRGVSPYHQNILKNGETLGYTDNSLARPVDEGPMWRANTNFKLRFDADGDLAGFVEVSNVRCLGPKEKD